MNNNFLNLIEAAANKAYHETVEKYGTDSAYCGTAWVKFSDKEIAKWLKKNKLENQYVVRSISYSDRLLVKSFNQSLFHKEKFAEAMVDELRKSNINCYWDSRVD